MHNHHEKQSEQRLDPRQAFELHKRGLVETWQTIRSSQTINRLGGVSLEGPHSFTYKSRKDFARNAEHQLNNTDPHDKDAQMYAALIAKIPNAVNGKHTLYNHHATQHQRYLAKMDMIAFDDMLRTTINTHKTLQEEAIVDLVVTTMLNYGYEAGDINMIAGETKRSLRGMKHELAVAATLFHLPKGYDVLDTTDEDDKHGADFIVRCPNGVLVYIDIKASQTTADEAIKRQHEYYSDNYREEPENKIILYSGFDDGKDFDPSRPWQPTPEAIQKVLPTIIENLRNASEAEKRRLSGKKGYARV